MRGTWQGSGTWQTSGGGPGLVALAVVLAVIAAVLHAIWHTIVEAAEIAAIVVVGAIAAAALAAAAYAVLRIRARMLGQRAREPITVRSVIVKPVAEPGELAGPPRALDAPVRLAEDQLERLAELIRNQRSEGR
jgi:hypothetical protein